jgi:hypothetical protein
MKAPRKKPARSLEHQIREECCQACANPNCREWSTATHELHHIDQDRSNSIKSNLILLCASCHNKEQVGVINVADVMLWKRMAEAGALPPPKGSPPSSGTTIQNNYGIAGTTVNIQELNMRRSGSATRRRDITPGLIEADADMRTYANYLVGRYIAWRKKGQNIDRRRFSSGSAHGILAEGFGSPSSVLLIPQARFFDWVVSAQAKIDRTAWGRINKVRKGRNYHSWEEHLVERRGNPKSGSQLDFSCNRIAHFIFSALPESCA